MIRGFRRLSSFVWRRPTRAWVALAVVLFASAAWSVYGEVWREDPSLFVPASVSMFEPRSWSQIVASDYDVVVGRVARNARALLTRPWDLYQDEQCHPLDNALATGSPMIASGLLGTPGYLVTGDPVVTYNVSLVLMALLSAAAMMALVWVFSGVPAAGIAAGIVQGFHAAKLADVVHACLFDNAWTVLAMLFAWRLFQHRRLLDAVALGVCCVLQMAESFYPFLAAVILALPYGAWLVAHRRGLPGWLGTVVVVAIIGLGALLIYSPYLEVVGPYRSTSVQAFAPLHRVSPWQVAGWPAAALALVGLVVRRRHCLREQLGDPRWALLAGAVLVALMATGGNAGDRLLAASAGDLPPAALPNPYAWLARYVPGMSLIRAPHALTSGVGIVCVILAGLGFAALLRRVPERARVSFAVLALCLLWVHTLRPDWLGLARREPFEAFRIAPIEERLDFYRRLAELGNDGPLLELPMTRDGRGRSLKVLQTAYHGRRTSACYMSAPPASYHRLKEVSRQLPADEAVREARRLGFTTIVLDKGNLSLLAWGNRIDQAVRDGTTSLRHLYATAAKTAYEIIPEAAERPPPAAGR